MEGVAGTDWGMAIVLAAVHVHIAKPQEVDIGLGMVVGTVQVVVHCMGSLAVAVVGVVAHRNMGMAVAEVGFDLVEDTAHIEQAVVSSMVEDSRVAEVGTLAVAAVAGDGREGSHQGNTTFWIGRGGWKRT